MEDPQAPAAPAQPAAPEAPVSAIDQAVASGDQSAFKAAKRAEREGKPIEAAPVAASAPVAKTTEPAETPQQTEQRQVSKRQQQINDYERRIAEQEQRIRLLESRGQAPQKPAPESSARLTQAERAALPVELQNFDNYLKTHPEAQYEDYTDARAEHRFEEKLAARAKEQQESTRRESLARTTQARQSTFQTALQEHVKTEPDFWERLSPEVNELAPLSVIPQERRDLLAQHALNPRSPHHRIARMELGRAAIAESVMDSALAPVLMRHFSDHPEDLARISELPPPQILRAMGRLEGQLTGASPKPSAPKPVSAMPRPTTLGTKAVEPTDPKDAAVANGDQAAYKAARLRERAAQYAS